jgi:hypothetical protein
MNFSKYCCVVICVFTTFVCNASELSKTRDCTVIELEPEIDPNMTTQENIQRLTEQFFESVNTVQHCEPPTDSASSGGGGGGGAAGGGAAGGGAAGGGAAGGGAAAASSDIAGTEAVITESAEGVATSPADSELSAIQSEIDEALKGSSGAEATAEKGAAATEVQDGNNGAIPDDIPPADNDSVFEAQIRAAAENETDPEVKKNLWNEYRKYKGLPIEE